jgi:hypothetical protein
VLDGSDLIGRTHGNASMVDSEAPSPATAAHGWRRASIAWALEAAWPLATSPRGSASTLVRP